MIEIYSVTNTGRFAYNNDTRRKEDFLEAGFSEMIAETGSGASDEGRVYSVSEEMLHESLATSDMEVATYTFTGKRSTFGIFAGKNVNYEV